MSREVSDCRADRPGKRVCVSVCAERRASGRLTKRSSKAEGDQRESAHDNLG